ncbi:PREDICTED: Golgi apparatus protein 1-like [Branchiostoma belcheri]|uniref:Golgi apparatus protein 1 n=1 Tax=Branchiostoma belcheri TaxID=7741 RepID=A0A6P4YWN4_BRABE|nr:PREDICTED: Golgi apparatus protein 1-like [Branchiostoma belcheri]
MWGVGTSQEQHRSHVGRRHHCSSGRQGYHLKMCQSSNNQYSSNRDSYQYRDSRLYRGSKPRSHGSRHIMPFPSKCYSRMLQRSQRFPTSQMHPSNQMYLCSKNFAAANPPNMIVPLNNAGQQNAQLGQVQSINQQGNNLDVGGVGGFAGGGLGDGGEDFRDQGQPDLQPLPGKVADIMKRNKKLVQKVQDVKNEGRLPEVPRIPLRAQNDPQMKVKLDGIPQKLAAPAAANQRSGGKGHMRIADNVACQEDVQRLCAHNVRTNNFAILDCLQNDRPKDNDLSPECHHFLWDYKKNLTKDIRFDQAAYEVCKEPLAQLPECSKLETGQGLVISCLMDHKGNISNQQCHQFLVKMTSIVFSDYRLIEHFVEDCSADIQKFQCGRVSSRDEEIDHTQGSVINCLQKKIGKKDGLQVSCMKQILRIGELSADDYHEDRALYFACREDRERFCEKIRAGEGHVLKCLVQHKFEHDMSDDCREKLIIRQRMVSQDYKVNYGLAKKCKEDIKHYHCRVDNMPEGKFAKLSFILLCLENAIQKGRQVSGDCQGEMFDMRRQLMSDFQISPEIVLNCRGEIESLCNGLQKEGRTIHCLMQNGMDDSKTGQNRLSKTCLIAVQSLVKEADAGFDYRMDVALQDACEPVVQTACKDIKPGDAMILSCLMEHLYTPSMVEDCEEKLLELQYFISRDWRLDPRMYRKCAKEAERLCNAGPDWNDTNDNLPPGIVFSCLYRHVYRKDEAKLSHACAFEVRRVMHQRAVDVRLNPMLEKACLRDLGEYCSENVEKGEVDVFDGATLQIPPDQEMHCLQDNFKNLSKPCRERVGNFTQMSSQDLDLDRIFMMSCAPMIKRYCKCREKLIIRQRMVSQDYKVNYGLAKKCKEDIKHYHCRVDNMPEGKFAKLSFILLCLENAIQKGRQVSGDCQGEMFDMRRQLMSDFQISPEIVLNCRGEIESLCNGLQKEGRTIHCLMQNGMDDSKTGQNRLSKTCLIAVQSLVKEADAGFDYRMDVALQDACEPVVQTACKDIKPGDAMILSCLMEHLYTPSMVEDCEEKLLELQYFISRDWRLDPRMYRKCAKEAERLCNAGPDWNDTNDNLPPGIVFSCLYRHVYRKDEAKLSHACAFEVRRVMHQRAVDVRLNPMLEKACLRDLGEYCSENVEKGEMDVFDGATLQIPPDQEMHCLQDNFKNLSKPCRERVGNFTQMSSQDLDLDRIFMMSCAPMIKRYCKDIVDKEEDDGALLQCLIENKNEHEMNKKCAAGIMHMQLIQLKDYRFSFKFKEACKSDVVKYCRNIKNKADLVSCLSEIVRNDTLMENKHRISKDCRGQLRVELLDRGEDVRLDPKLMHECHDDIKKHCDTEQAGDARMLECLKRHKKKLSDGCHIKLFNREREELTDNSVDYGFMRDCKPMVKRFCPQSDPKDVLHCLRKNKNNEFMDERCRKAITQRQIEQAEDYRLDVELQKKCKKDVPKFCRDILAEARSTELEGKVIGCLKAKVGKNRLSPQCEDHIKELMREAAIDYRMDPQLAQGCMEEMTKMCSEEMTNLRLAVWRSVSRKSSLRKINSAKLLRLLQEGKADIHVDPLLHQSCALDIKHYCAGIPAGEGRRRKSALLDHSLILECPVVILLLQEMHCLQDNFKNLSKPCRERVGNFTQMSSQDLDLDRIFMMSCAPMIKRYCKDIVDKEEDDGALLQCLIENKNEHEMNKKCAAGIMHMQLIQLKDYRFSFKFKEACKSDVVKYCRNIKNKADLVSCLSEIVRNDTLMENKHRISKDCRGQLRVELLDRGEDVRLDPKLMHECHDDIKKHCDTEQAGDARMLECLKRHKKKLSDGCHIKLFNREREELTDNSVDYGFMRDCKPMVKRFCPQSDPKDVLHCLRKNKNNEFMDERCRKAITQRQIEQAEDYRLDVELQKKCKKDVPKFCRDILAEARSTELEGKVIGCLKAKVGKNRLSPQCEDHIKELMREAAIDYRMDPQLAQGCMEEMTKMCSEEMTNPETGSVEECLKKKFSEKNKFSKMCQTQVLRLLQEGKADIHVDPLLHQSCALDIKHYCAGIPAGEGRQMSCLLEALEDRTVHLQRDCEEKLKSRVEMWEYAAKVAPPETFNELMVQMSASPARNYFVGVICGAVLIILCLGVLTGRMTKRVRAELKNR